MTLQIEPEKIGFKNMVNRIDYRDKESFRFSRECFRTWGHLNEVLDWCKAELVEDWRWQLIDLSTDTRPGRYIFYFDGERDCLAFTLKWG